MKKFLIIISILICFLIGIGVSGYIFIKRTTSDEAIKSRLLSALKDFGETKIEEVPEWENVKKEVDWAEGADPSIFYCSKSSW